TGDTFAISSTDGNEDFAATNANASNHVFITYIDKLAASTTESSPFCMSRGVTPPSGSVRPVMGAFAL
ncbi:MAG: hypothetical protein NWP84_06105, partial [Cyanobium sp. MAG_04]|nr:hypothetical protein [Cyanobium sp. MAG_04]